MSQALRFALRRLRRGWASGELLILALALTVSVAAASAVGLFTDRVRRAVSEQTGDAIGADAVISSRSALPPELVEQLRGLGLRTADTTEFSSVVLAGDDTLLVSVKAAPDAYPLRGKLRIADQPFGTAREVQAAPKPGEAWVDARVWQTLNLKPGGSFQLGQSSFRAGAVIEYEPDRGAGFADMAPRVLINRADLAATGLIGIGSRVQYALLLAGTPQALTAAEALERPAGARFLNAQTARPEVGRALGRAGQFLDIAVLAALLLSAAAVALSARQHGDKLRDEVALLKCLGADRRSLGLMLTLQLLVLGLIAGVVGAAIGFAGQAVLAQLLSVLLKAQLPPPSIIPLLAAFAVELLLLAGFALPPLLQARQAPPMRVFQRDASGPKSWWVAVLAMAAVVALLWWQSSDAKLALWVLLGAAGCCAVLAALAWLMVRALSPLRRAGHTAVRFGLGNVARRKSATLAQVVALGTALLALLLVTVVSRDLLSSWQKRVPADAPNQFLMNIQPEQVKPLKAFFSANGISDLHLWPMARGRLVAFNGKPVTAESFDDPETRRWINREFNLSWTERFDADNTLIDGQWWTAADAGKPYLSIDKYVVDRLGAKLGDRMTLQIADRQVELTVTSIRTVKWESFRPNFFLVAAPGVIDTDAQWLTSVHLAPEQRGLMRDLILQFPNVTAFDIQASLDQVRGIVDRIIQAVQFIFLFTLAAGATVLLAAIESTRAERVRETALLRTLGASSRTITGGLLTEYAALGLLSGAVAAASAQILAWVLAREVFDLPYTWSPLLWLGGCVLGAVLVSGLGWLSLRRTLKTPPRVVLAGG